MVVMNDDASSIGMAIHSLASFPLSVLESILFQRPKKVTNWNILKFMNHKEMATADPSMNVPDEVGSSSLASAISSI